MKDLWPSILSVIAVVVFLYCMYWLFKTCSYWLFYEGMVEDTIRQMVDSGCLNGK